MVEGACLELNDAELTAADDYEVAATSGPPSNWPPA
jgi:hypothetical protein